MYALEDEVGIFLRNVQHMGRTSESERGWMDTCIDDNIDADLKEDARKRLGNMGCAGNNEGNTLRQDREHFRFRRPHPPVIASATDQKSSHHLEEHSQPHPDNYFFHSTLWTPLHTAGGQIHTAAGALRLSVDLLLSRVRTLTDVPLSDEEYDIVEAERDMLELLQNFDSDLHEVVLHAHSLLSISEARSADFFKAFSSGSDDIFIALAQELGIRANRTLHAFQSLQNNMRVVFGKTEEIETMWNNWAANAGKVWAQSSCALYEHSSSAIVFVRTLAEGLVDVVIGPPHFPPPMCDMAWTKMSRFVEDFDVLAGHARVFTKALGSLDILRQRVASIEQQLLGCGVMLYNTPPHLLAFMRRNTSTITAFERTKEGLRIAARSYRRIIEHWYEDDLRTIWSAA